MAVFLREFVNIISNLDMSCFENSEDPDQLASEMIADQVPY